MWRRLSGVAQKTFGDQRLSAWRWAAENRIWDGCFSPGSAFSQLGNSSTVGVDPDMLLPICFQGESLSSALLGRSPPL
jgi:hypothetical protein